MRVNQAILAIEVFRRHTRAFSSYIRRLNLDQDHVHANIYSKAEAFYPILASYSKRLF